jgi:hypothetical protein
LFVAKFSFKGGRALGGAGACLEEIVRAARRHSLKKVGELLKAVVLGALAQESEFRLVVGVFVDLSVIKPGGADNLSRPVERPPLVAAP